MNIMGIGTLELLAVLLIAFIFLGPNRLVDLARLLGKASREAKRLTDDLPEMLLKDENFSGDKKNDDDIQSPNNIIGHEDSTGKTDPIAFKAANQPSHIQDIEDTKTGE